MLESETDHFDGGVKTEFIEDIGLMAIDGAEGDMELIGDLLAEESVAAGFNYLEFAFGEQRRGFLIELGINDITHEDSEVTAIERYTFRDGVDGQFDLLERTVLADKPVDADIHELGDDILFCIDREHDDLDIRVLGAHTFGHFEAVGAGHEDVQQEKVAGRAFLEGGEEIFGAGRGDGDCMFRVMEDAGDTDTDQLMIV